MSRTKIINRTLDSVHTLPFPLQGSIGPSDGVIVAHTPTEVMSFYGGVERFKDLGHLMLEIVGAAETAVADNPLTSVDAGKGASQVAVRDLAGNFVSTDVEATLAEIMSLLASNATGEGASLVTIEDIAGVIVSTDVEAALFEIHGSAENRIVRDHGISAHAVLRLANDVIEAETVSIGADVYEAEVVNTDRTENTQGGDFVPVTNPLTVTDFVTNYPAGAVLAVGDLMRIQNEIMRVTAIDTPVVGDVTFKRGVSGTTAATHADANDMYDGDGIAGPSTVAVGLVAVLTPAAFSPALIADINEEATEYVSAVVGSAVAEMLLFSSESPGDGFPLGNDMTIALAETLTGVTNEWDTAAMRSGDFAAEVGTVRGSHLVDQTEVDLTFVQIPLPITPTGFTLQVRTATGLNKEITDLVTIQTAPDRLRLDLDGATSVAAGDTIHFHAWER